MKNTVIAIIAIPFVLIGLWWVAVPETLIIRHMEDALGRQGMKLRIMGFSKGLLYNFNVGQMHVSTEKDFPVVIVNDLHARIDFLSILKCQPQLVMSGRVNDGRVYGGIGLRGQGTGGGRTININGDRIDINGIPALKRFGVRGDGNLGFDFHLMDDTGDARFCIGEARFEGAFPGIDFLPMDLIQRVRGTLTVEKTITLKSMTLEGRGIYARVNGNISGNSLDMKIELMMDLSCELEPVLAKALEPYALSPGYYVIKLSYIFPSV